MFSLTEFPPNEQSHTERNSLMLDSVRYPARLYVKWESGRSLFHFSRTLQVLRAVFTFGDSLALGFLVTACSLKHDLLIAMSLLPSLGCRSLSD